VLRGFGVNGAVASAVGSQVGMMAWLVNGVMPKPVRVIWLFISLTIGSTTQSVTVFGGMAQPEGAPVGGAPVTAVSIALQVEEPWSNAQLCPPTAATGNPAMPLPFNAMVLGPTAELLFSKLELSGMKTDPAVPVNMFGDMFANDGATVLSVEYTNPWFPAGKVVPSEQTAHAKFWVRNVPATATAATRRIR
jgi:hypothetical protein